MVKKKVSKKEPVLGTKLLKVMEQRDKLLEAFQESENKVKELELAIEDQNNVIDHFKEAAHVASVAMDLKPSSSNAFVEIFTDPDPFALISKKIFIFENMLYNHYREHMKLYAVKPNPAPIPVSHLKESGKLPAYDQYVIDCKVAQENSEVELYGIQVEVLVG